MSGFLKNIIHRHVHRAGIIQPRKRGLFEPAQAAEPAPLEATASPGKDSPPRLSGKELPTSEPMPPPRTDNPPLKSKSGAERQETEVTSPSEGPPQRKFELEELVFKPKTPPEKPEIKAPPVTGPEFREEGFARSGVNSPPDEEQYKETNSEQFLFEETDDSPEKSPRELFLRLKQQEPPRAITAQLREEVRTRMTTYLQARAVQPPGQEPQSPPSVKIHIGRIEIKAEKAAERSPQKPAKPAPKIKSLDQILQERGRK